MPSSNSKYFPGTYKPIPETLRAWRNKYRKVGKKVYVLAFPTLSELVKRFGPDAKLDADKVAYDYVPATPEQTAEYEHLKCLWDVKLNEALFGDKKARVRRLTTRVMTLTSSLAAAKRSLAIESARLQKLTAQRDALKAK